jgi:hypothetical protein
MNTKTKKGTDLFFAMKNKSVPFLVVPPMVIRIDRAAVAVPSYERFAGIPVYIAHAEWSLRGFSVTASTLHNDHSAASQVHSVYTDKALEQH